MPRPRFVLAVPTLLRSLRLLVIASLVLSVAVIPVSCDPSITGRPVASATITLPLATPVSLVDAVPRPRLVLAVPTLLRSLRLLAMASLVLSVAVIPVSCDPSITGRPVASATITLPLATPVSLVEAVPRVPNLLSMPSRCFSILSLVVE